jgi:bifunctional N-acetylglucosamine-1-phosphate-uridyltransferase/glucosamine-1-phosphate-acetyltransferase GlmU-like protein
MAENFSYKFVAENKPLSFEFSEVLASGESLSTASCSVIVLDGTDASPSSLLSGSATITGTKVYQRVHNGTAGVTYRIIVTVTTSAGSTLVAVGDIPVYSPDEVQ